jgi:hypothetical protein
MQQENRFFYEDRNRDINDTAYSTSNAYTTASNPVNESWASKTTLNPGSGASLQNPFEDVSRQNTLTNEPPGYSIDQTSKALRQLSYDEEKQAEYEEGDININSENSSLNTTTTDASNVHVDHSKSIAEGEQDTDHEFDWNDDPGQVKPKRKNTARERFTAAMQSPCCWHYLSPILKRIVIAILGSCIFIILAVVIYVILPAPTEAQLQDPNFTNIRSNGQCWMYWAAFMWHIFWITTFLLDMVPSAVSLWIKLFYGRRSEKVKSYMEVTFTNEGKRFILILFVLVI